MIYNPLYALWLWRVNRAARELDPALSQKFTDLVDAEKLRDFYDEGASPQRALFFYAFDVLNGKRGWNDPARAAVVHPLTEEVKTFHANLFGNYDKMSTQAKITRNLREQSVANEKRMMGDRVLKKGTRVSVLPLRGEFGTIIGVSEGFGGQPYYQIAVDNAKPDAMPVFCYARQLQWTQEEENEPSHAI